MTNQIIKIFFISSLLSFTNFASAADEFVMVQGYQLDVDSSKMSEQEAAGLAGDAADALRYAEYVSVEIFGQEAVEEFYEILFPTEEDYPLEEAEESGWFFKKHDQIVKQLSTPNKAVPYVIYFTKQAMRMNTPEHSMVWKLSNDGNTAYMAFADHAKKEVTELTNLTNIGELNMLSAEYSGFKSSSTGNSDEMLGVNTSEYNYSFSVTMAGPLSLGNIFTNPGGGSKNSDISSRTSGVAWLSKDIPGYSIIKEFFDKFASGTENDNQSLMNTAIAGFARSMSDMINLGFPLNDSRFSLTSGPSSPMSPPILLPSITANQVADVTVLTLTDSMAAYISGGKFPKDYNFVDPMKMQDGSDVKFEMPPEVKEAFEKMTPEQRKMMESMGLDKMMKQIMQ
ncbi:hypothetical protein [Paraglaciecola sp. 25GB23A]|uniref:hypothetical protein n=1 Tax=Paraglaciecola sp. 25GB23A TaxID=3156068 RepID=UPI0032AFA5FA